MRTLSKLLLFSLLAIISSLYAHAQASTTLICGKKWYWEMTKDASGEVHEVDTGATNDYMYFKCDSNFVLEEQGTELKGTWTFDTGTMTIILFQHQINSIPERITFHLIDYDEGKLVIMGREGTNEEQTGFLYTK